jgi:hypothetical protein
MAKASTPSLTAASTTQSTKTLAHKLSSILLGGEKGSGLPGYVDLMNGGTNTPSNLKPTGRNGSGRQQENPVARLKLLLVCFIIPFHYKYF